MSFSVVGSTGTHAVSVDTVINVPAGVVDGDLLFALIEINPASKTVATPTGWTALDADSDASAPSAASFYRVASSEPASYTWATGVLGATCNGTMVAARGANQTTPINAHGAFQQNASTTTPAATSIITTADGCLLLYVLALSGTVATFTPPTGYTDDTPAAVSNQACVAHEVQTTAGATGSTSCTLNGARTGTAQLVALAPAASSPPTNTVAPVVSGTTTVGQTLTTTNGTWTDNGGSTFTYQWQDSADGSTGWANIASATNQTYTIGSGELNKFIRCVVTDTDSTTQATAANSNVVGAIAAAPSLSTVAGKTGTGGTAVMQKAASGWTYITGKKNTSGTAVDQKGLGGFTKIKGH